MKTCRYASDAIVIWYCLYNCTFSPNIFHYDQNVVRKVTERHSDIYWYYCDLGWTIVQKKTEFFVKCLTLLSQLMTAAGEKPQAHEKKMRQSKKSITLEPANIPRSTKQPRLTTFIERLP